MSRATNIEYPKHYLVVPRSNCEHWEYLPICFTDSISAGNYWYIAPQSDLFQFGILNSAMHMAWIKCVSGRLGGYDRLHHSPAVKHFPWPITHTQAHISSIEEKAIAILAIRDLYPSMPLKDLYNPLTMPEALQEAHKELDKAVDAAYGQTYFASDDSRVGFLLHLQRQLSSLLIHLYDDSAALADPIYYQDNSDNSFGKNRYSANSNNSAF